MNILKRLMFWMYCVLMLVSFLDVSAYMSMRSIWFFINKTIGGSMRWDILILVMFAVSFIYITVLFIRYIKNFRTGNRHTVIVNIILPVILAILFSGIDAYLYSMLGSGKDMVIRNLLSYLPYVILMATMIFLLTFYPSLRISKSKVFKYTAVPVVILLLVVYLLDFGGVSIVSGPFIQMVDDSNLAVMWTTNKKSTGYVEYGKDQNSLNRIYPSDNGVVDANTTLHKVIIPIGDNQEFIYRVGSTKIEGYFQNNVEYGNTALSKFKEFKDFRQNDTISFYILSDIHENTDIYKTFLSKDDYDFVVLNGDYVNSVDNDSVVVDKVLTPISTYTNGEKPIYFVRGNHETRGASLRDLPDFIALPQNRFYYTFSVGSLYAVVLDSGEDKEDSDIEYSGLADFERYRELETEWLHKLPNSNEYKDAKYRIAFVHIPLNSYEDLDPSNLKDYQQQWRGILNDMDMDAVFSGHTHEDAVIEAGSFGSSYPIFIGGGESGSGKGYIAIKVEVAENNLKVSYLDTDGKETYEYGLK